MNVKSLKLIGYGVAIGAAAGVAAKLLADYLEQRRTGWFYGGMSGHEFRQITDTRVSERELRALRASKPDRAYLC